MDGIKRPSTFKLPTRTSAHNVLQSARHEISPLITREQHMNTLGIQTNTISAPGNKLFSSIFSALLQQTNRIDAVPMVGSRVDP
jgi:hypothetical protein